jgi:MoxR-like ATPase
MTNRGENTVNPYDDEGLSPAYQGQGYNNINNNSVQATPATTPAQQSVQQKQADRAQPEKAPVAPRSSANPAETLEQRVISTGQPAITTSTKYDESGEPGEQDIAHFIEVTHKLEQELQSIVVGQERVIRELLLALLAGGHVLLEGVPGLGKTLLVRTLSETLDLKFARIQFTPDLMPADIVGTNIISEQSENGSSSKRGFTFQPGPIFANIVLADEINRATPKTQSALLEGMQERTVSVGDRTRTLPQPFFVLATQNPLEMEGTYPLPEAQLDRFMLKITVNFPKAADLLRIVDNTVGTQTLHAQVITDGSELTHLIKIARAVPVATNVKEYAVHLLLATHPDQDDAPEKVRQYVRYGASPRGLQALITTARVRALLEGRYNASIEDIQTVAYPVLRHRIALNFDGLADNITPEQIIGTIIDELETA